MVRIVVTEQITIGPVAGDRFGASVEKRWTLPEL
jgi:hypothetical protein